MSEEPLSEVFRHEMSVPVEVIDENGHVNNVAYLQWMNDAALSHFRALGGEVLLDELSATWVARSHHIEYLRPLYEGDELVVRPWIATLERVKSVRRYSFESGEKVIARGETVWVLVDRTSGRPQRIPAEMETALRRTG